MDEKKKLKGASDVIKPPHFEVKSYSCSTLQSWKWYEHLIQLNNTIPILTTEVRLGVSHC